MINILISVDSKYLDKAQTMLFSLRLSTRESVTVYLLDYRLSTEEKNRLSQYLEEKCQMQLTVIDVRETDLDSLPVGRYSIEMYFRILAQFLLPKSLDRILWLDADIVLLKSITEFYYQSFEGNKYIVCAESQGEEQWLKEQKKTLDLPDEHIYFNSGVMLMNLELLRKSTNMHDIVEQCYLLRDNLRCPDQDILNFLYQGQVKYAEPKKYNYQLTSTTHIPHSDIQNIVVLHYSGYRKPWNYWQITNASKYYWKIRCQQGEITSALKAYILKYWEIVVNYWRKLKNSCLNS